jgi:hypothetical protein
LIGKQLIEEDGHCTFVHYLGGVEACQDRQSHEKAKQHLVRVLKIDQVNLTLLEKGKLK